MKLFLFVHQYFCSLDTLIVGTSGGAAGGNNTGTTGGSRPPRPPGGIKPPSGSSNIYSASAAAVIAGKSLPINSAASAGVGSGGGGSYSNGGSGSSGGGSSNFTFLQANLHQSGAAGNTTAAGTHNPRRGTSTPPRQAGDPGAKGKNELQLALLCLIYHLLVFILATCISGQQFCG